MGSYGGDQTEVSSGRGNKAFHRHRPEQISRLESFFKECPNPNENQRCQLGRELGLNSKQIKFWFQNKRTLAKSQNERADNSFLRAENEIMRSENLAMREAMERVICTSCDGSPNAGDREHVLQKLKLENAKMKEEYDKIAAFLARHLAEPFPESKSPAPISETSMDTPQGSFTTNEIDGSVIDPDQATENENVTTISLHLSGSLETEKAHMIETSSGAMAELIRLLHVNEPLWIKSSATQKYVIDYNKYETLLPKGNHLSSAQVESSKEISLVPMSSVQLVDMLLDSGKCKALFPNIINYASTIYTVDNGMPENHDGFLQLMYQKMHSLSPLVQPREFYFLRRCHQLVPGVWIIADISYNISKGSIFPCASWRRPSGCMIQDTPNGFSKVTWIEHVEINDQGQTHSLYQDLVRRGLAYGAERWVATLQRMCERFNFCQMNMPPADGVVEGHRGVTRLSQRMIEEFCSMLCTPGRSDSPPLAGIDNSGVRINFRKNRDKAQSNSMLINAVASFWLPILPDDIFKLLSDESARVQWDILSGGNSVQSIARIPSGNDRRNCISILHSSPFTENSLMILQETCVDALGSMIVYAPIDYPTLKAAAESDLSIPKINPSGFIIAPDCCPESLAGASTSKGTHKPSGSLVTVALQILTPYPSPRHVGADSIRVINDVIGNTVQKIKAVLNCSDSV